MPIQWNQMRLLTVHFALFQCGVSLAGGFIGAYFLKSGFSLTGALTVYAAYLAIRSVLRFASLEVVRRVGYKQTLMLGTMVIAFQFLPLMHADRRIWLGAWMLCIALGESLYWPVYHGTIAVTGDSERRGRQLGMRTMVSTLIGVAAPLTGAWLLVRVGPAADFGIAAVLMVMATLPILFLRRIPAGPVPSVRDAIRGADRLSLLAFVGDGWLSAGLFIAWPMILFQSLGMHYEAFGASTAAAGIVGAAAGYLCGRGIDRGHRERYLNGVCLMLLVGLVMRSTAAWSPLAANMANMTGAAVGALYTPVLMSAIYERAKRSGASFRFHFAAEAGWDLGAVSGCLTAATMAWLCRTAPSLAVLPAMAGIALVFACVRNDGRTATGDAPALAGDVAIA